MKIIIPITLLLLNTRIAFAQSTPGQGFFDKYLPIAELFDSPVFFSIVIGSAVLLLVCTLIFLKYAKSLEKKTVAWAEGKSPQTLVELLSSPIKQEATMAYAYLKNNCGDDEADLLVKDLQDQRSRGSINSILIYLLEDLEVEKAIPTLQQIARGKSSAAALAQRAADRIAYAYEEEESEKPQPAKS